MRVVTCGDDIVADKVENRGNGGAGVQLEVVGGRSYSSETKGTDVAPLVYKVCSLAFHQEFSGCSFPLSISCVVLPTTF